MHACLRVRVCMCVCVRAFVRGCAWDMLARSLCGWPASDHPVVEEPAPLPHRDHRPHPHPHPHRPPPSRPSHVHAHARERERALAVLGLGPAASHEAVVKAYKRLALKHHPDKCRKERNGEKAKETFLRISKAYKTLTALS